MDAFVVASKQDGVLHQPLSAAAAQAYYQVTGAKPRDGQLLNRVAHALTCVIPIYVLDGATPVLRQVTPIELLQSTFSNGASVLTFDDGTELRALSVRRKDLIDAVVVLRAIKVRFGDQQETPPPSVRHRTALRLRKPEHGPCSTIFSSGTEPN